MLWFIWRYILQSFSWWKGYCRLYFWAHFLQYLSQNRKQAGNAEVKVGWLHTMCWPFNFVLHSICWFYTFVLHSVCWSILRWSHCAAHGVGADRTVVTWQTFVCAGGQSPLQPFAQYPNFSLKPFLVCYRISSPNIGQSPVKVPACAELLLVQNAPKNLA